MKTNELLTGRRVWSSNFSSCPELIWQAYESYDCDGTKIANSPSGKHWTTESEFGSLKFRLWKFQTETVRFDRCLTNRTKFRARNSRVQFPISSKASPCRTDVHEAYCSPCCSLPNKLALSMRTARCWLRAKCRLRYVDYGLEQFRTTMIWREW